MDFIVLWRPQWEESLQEPRTHSLCSPIINSVKWSAGMGDGQRFGEKERSGGNIKRDSFVYPILPVSTKWNNPLPYQSKTLLGWNQ